MNNLVDTMEGFFDNVSNSPDIKKITKFTHHIPGPVFEFNPKKFTFSIYSTVFKYIRYDFQISDFIKDVMSSTDNDDNYIIGKYKIDENELELIVRLAYKNKKNIITSKEYKLKLIPSPFAKIRKAFSKDIYNEGGWIIDTMNQLEVNNKSKYKVEDNKKAIKEIYDLL